MLNHKILSVFLVQVSVILGFVVFLVFCITFFSCFFQVISKIFAFNLFVIGELILKIAIQINVKNNRKLAKAIKKTFLDLGESIFLDSFIASSFFSSKSEV